MVHFSAGNPPASACERMRAEISEGVVPGNLEVGAADGSDEVSVGWTTARLRVLPRSPNTARLTNRARCSRWVDVADSEVYDRMLCCRGRRRMR